MAGLPPLLGFVAKEALLDAMLEFRWPACRGRQRRADGGDGAHPGLGHFHGCSGAIITMPFMNPPTRCWSGRGCWSVARCWPGCGWNHW